MRDVLATVDVANLVVGGVIGFAVGFFTRWPLDKLAERRDFVRSIADRYIERAHADPRFREDEFLRIGMLQNLGAAELRLLEFRRVCRRIVSRGLKDPRNREMPIFNDRRRQLRYLLRWAARKGVSLTEGGALLRIAAEEADAAVAQGADRKGKLNP